MNIEQNKLVGKIHIFIIWIVLILLPFNGLPYFKGIFGEFSVEGAFYPLLLGIPFWLIFLSMKYQNRKLHLSYKILIIFFIWIVITSVINYPTIANHFTKEKTGFEKLILQTLVFVFVSISAFFFLQNVNNTKQFLQKFRTIILISFLLPSIYSFFELLSFIGIQWSKDILGFLSKILQGSSELYGYRIRSVCGEASWFAMFSSFAFPWILSYIFTSYKKKWMYYFLISYLILLIILSKSRTAEIIISVEIFAFIIGLIISKSIKKYHWDLIYLIIIIFFLIGITNFSVFNSFSGSNTNNNINYQLSNISRIGSIVDALKMAIDHPIFGVGFGQYGFRMSDYVPKWALQSWEIQSWMSNSADTPWPPVHCLYARIAAELGLVGFLIWIGLWFSILFSGVKLFYLCYKYGNPNILELALLVSVFGVLLTGFSSDSFRFFGYWINLGLFWTYYSNQISFKRRINEEREIEDNIH